MWQQRYIKPNSENWLTRPDSPAFASIAQQVQCKNLLSESLSKAKSLTFAFLGFKSDEGVIRNFGQAGAIEGPDAIRNALGKLPLHREGIICYDLGDIACFDGKLETAQEALGDVVATLLKLNIVPLLLGGGHEIAWGHYQGLLKAFPRDRFGIINFDAHFDMRPIVDNISTSGTPFLQIAEASQEQKKKWQYYCFGIQSASNTSHLFDTAKKFKTKFLLAENIHLKGIKSARTLLKQAIKTHSVLYTSICLDVFASCFAPGVSAQQPLGLLPWQVIPLIRQLAASGKVKTYDVAEVAPARDIDLRTAKLAAYLLFEIIHTQAK